MFHYSSQAVYHSEVYQLCPINSEEKNQETPYNPTALSQDTFPAPVDILPTQPKILKKDRLDNNCSKGTTVDTSNFSIEERLVAAVWVHERKRTKASMSQIKYDFRQRFGREPPATNTLLVWDRKLFATGSVCDAPRPGRPVKRKARVEEVASSLRAAPSLPLRARARALRLPRSTLRTILRADLPPAASTPAGKEVVKKRTKRQSSKKPQAATQEATPPPAHSLALHPHTQGYT